MIYYKAFRYDLTCNGYQFCVGETFESGGGMEKFTGMVISLL